MASASRNTIQDVSNVLRPALLILFLSQSRRAGLPCGDGRTFDDWQAPIVRASVVCMVIVSTGFGIGFTMDRSALVSAFTTVVAVASLGGSVRASRRPASSG